MYNKLFNFKSIYILWENMLFINIHKQYFCFPIDFMELPMINPQLFCHQKTSPSPGRKHVVFGEVFSGMDLPLAGRGLVDGFKDVLLQNMRIPWESMVFIGVYWCSHVFIIVYLCLHNVFVLNVWCLMYDVTFKTQVRFKRPWHWIVYVHHMHLMMNHDAFINVYMYQPIYFITLVQERTSGRMSLLSLWFIYFFCNWYNGAVVCCSPQVYPHKHHQAPPSPFAFENSVWECHQKLPTEPKVHHPDSSNIASC